MTATTPDPSLGSASSVEFPTPDPDDWNNPPDAIWWLDTGYVPARFGSDRVLLTPEFAAEVKQRQAAKS